MTKRILGMAIAAILILGLGGVALAAGTPGRPSFGLDNADLAAADPAPSGPAGGAGGKGAELKACVAPKVAAGADRRTARQECAAQLGIKAGRQGGLTRFGKAAHAEAVVPKKGAAGQWETVVLDRGKVTAASPDAISVQRPDGPTVTLKVVPTTKVKGAASASDLKPDREVVVVSAGGEARAIVARP